MDVDELDLRRTLSAGLSPDALTRAVQKQVSNNELAWEQRRPYWVWLYQSGREATLIETAARGLAEKSRVPFDLLIHLCSRQNLAPSAMVVAATLKGVRKQRAQAELLVVTGWDSLDPRISLTRDQLRAQKADDQRRFKDGLLEKFEFLQSQRMTDQARRTLKRMLELYPDDAVFLGLKSAFDESWARDVLANHMASSQRESGRPERTRTEPSSFDEAMLQSFLLEGERLSVDSRALAADLAIAFWFVGDHPRGLEILHWAEPNASTDWLRAEMLFEARRFIEALEWLNQLETKYVGDPESTFAISYLRAQCLKESGQPARALEILQSIVRVRPNYRSTNALLTEWLEGASWE